MAGRGCRVGENGTHGPCNRKVVSGDKCKRHSELSREIARLTSWEECIVSDCALEHGHSGPHEYFIPEVKP